MGLRIQNQNKTTTTQRMEILLKIKKCEPNLFSRTYKHENFRNEIDREKALVTLGVCDHFFVFFFFLFNLVEPHRMGENKKRLNQHECQTLPTTNHRHSIKPTMCIFLSGMALILIYRFSRNPLEDSCV